MQIEVLEINSIKSDGKNPNAMTPVQHDALEKNIREFGFKAPIWIDQDNLLIDGEQRWTIAKRIGMKEIPVIRFNVTDAQRRMLRQVANKLKGTHDPRLDAGEFKLIFEHIPPAELASFMGVTELEVAALAEIAPPSPSVKEVSFQATKHKCPSCGYQF